MAEEIEPGFFIMDNFEEAKPYYKKLFLDKKVGLLYKMRNWRERFHPEFLTKGEMYFARPDELNDPFDIHRPLKFDVSVIDKPEFLEKMIQSAPEARNINPGRDATIYAEKELEQIKANPDAYFLKNYLEMINDRDYNNKIGVLSLTVNPLNDQIWGYYGGGQRGFAVGFDPIGLCENIFSEGQFVNYTDTIPVSGIINTSMTDQSTLMFQKNKKWGFEDEFRFVRFLESEERRIHRYPPEIVKEVILGPRIPDDDKYEITETISTRYSHVSISQIVCDYNNGKTSKIVV